MEPTNLTHRDCVWLIGRHPRRVIATISVEGAAVIPLTAFVCPGGDVLVPTGPDRTLSRAAVNRPVRIEFTGAGTHGHGDTDETDDGGWTITGTGLARPLTAADRPAGGAAHAMRDAFEGGIHVLMARLSGYRPAPTPVPAQRTGSPEPLPPETVAVEQRRVWVPVGAATESAKNPGLSGDGCHRTSPGSSGAEQRGQRSGE
ncbi:hypothetical protein BJF85_18780 [Saccharomonospora sp. CUA-673]|uniref:hypothetical protein n=1 Tax=Saccharomonospora sp. CUA-673 TaxID=1904969 RepID=UPI0009628470|nr:hypothetical protein [Saccharomonospora sp. CUA-673]OLT45425.1 hypothetical protein BJF85_18780 [Saccharomonospora sp. CUA-673]